MYLNEETYKVEKIKTGKKKSELIKHTKEWIYFKIYCHPLSADIILCDHIIPLVKKYNKNGDVKEWFWVRYNDPGYHIRFRIKPCQSMRACFFEALVNCLNTLALHKLVNRFQPDIYKQESDRYSSDLITKVETIFTASSNIAGNFLKNKSSHNYSDEKVIVEAALSINEILLEFGLDNNERIQFCKFQFDQFYIEFKSPKTLKAELEKLYKRLFADIVAIFNCKKSSNSYNVLKRDTLNLIQEFKIKKVKVVTLTKLAVDIIHMHLNRLYFDNQRYLEMVTYFIVYRTLNAEIHKSKVVYVSEAV